jgi:broad specificity phosphatase PhoE
MLLTFLAMVVNWRYTARLTAVLFMVALAHSAGAQQPLPLAGEALVSALRKGGYNIYFRHAATDWSLDDHVSKSGDWTSCDPQKMRQLAPAGRQTAEHVGKAMRALRIPVGQVLASPYCRTLQTARLMGLGPVETTTDIMNTRVAGYFGGVAAVAKRARKRLSIPPKAGTNTVLVAHGNVLRAATEEYTGEAGAVVFRPQSDGRYSVVAHVTPQDWQRLAAEFAQPVSGRDSLAKELLSR